MRLRRAVHLYDKRGRLHSWRPGDVVPEWAARRITNPAVWAPNERGESVSRAAGVPEGVGPTDAGGPTPSGASVTTAITRPALAAVAVPTAEPGPETPAISLPVWEPLSEPPRSGPGSNRKAWAEYAASIGIEYTATDGRDALIAAVDEASRRVRGAL